MKLVAILVAHYPRQELTVAQQEALAQSIVAFELETMTQAIYATVGGSKFFPTVAELREAYAALKLGAPEPLHAWAQAVGPAPRHELVQRARRLVGDDWTWRNEPEWSHRKPFLEAYGEVLRQAIQAIAQPELEAARAREMPVPAAPAQLEPARRELERMAVEDVRPYLSEIEGILGRIQRRDGQ